MKELAATTKMSKQTKKRIEAAREASRLVKGLPAWKLTGLQLTCTERGSTESGSTVPSTK